jgi:16S rRNA processing protein RimM
LPLSLDEFICIGYTSKTFGNKGFIKVEPLTDFPERFKVLKRVFLFDEVTNKFKRCDGESLEFIVSEISITPESKIRISFKGFSTLNAAEELVGLFIFIPESEKWKRPDDSYYNYEMIGLKVINGNEEIGTITGIENYGSDNLFKVLLNGTNTEILIPDRAEFVYEVNLEKGFIRVELIEGFL